MRVFLHLLLMVFLVNASFVKPEKPTIHIVKMIGMKFVPKSVEIKVGDKIRWINKSNSRHNVIAKTGDFESSMLAKGQVFEMVFSKTGEYKYFCRPHRLMGMKGTIIVKN